MPLNETSYLSLAADLNPQEAADNIKQSVALNMPADGVAELKDEIKADQEENFVKTSRPVARTLAKSDQHKAAIRKDVSVLNKVSNFIDYTKTVLDGKDLSGELFQLQYKKVMQGKPTLDLGEFTPQDNFRVLELNSQLQELHNQQQDYGYDFAQSLPAEVIGGGYDFGKMLWRGRDLTLTGAGVGGAGGAAIGAFGGPIPAAFGAGLGAFKGALIGTGVGLVRDAFQQGTGQIYNDLNFILPEGKPLPETEKKAIAIGGGAAMALVSVIPVGAIFRNTPFVNKLASPRIFTKYVMSPQGGPLREILKSMAYTGIAEGIEEGSQEYIQAIANEMGKTWDGSESSFIDGMMNAINKQTAERALKAGTIGALTGAAIQGGLSTVGTVVESKLQSREVDQPPERDVTPRPGTPDLPLLPAGPSDISGESGQMPVSTKGIRAIQLKVAVDQTVQATKDTDTNQNLPFEMDEIRQQMWEESGNIPSVWIDKEELNKWADNDEKAELLRSIIDRKGFLATELNSPLRIEMHKFMRIAEDHPDITDLIKAYPEGPSAQQQLDSMEQANKRRKTIIQEIPGRDPILPQQITPEVQGQIESQIESHEIAIRADEEGRRQAQDALARAEDPATRQRLQGEIDRYNKRIDNSFERIKVLRDYETSQGDFRIKDQDIFGEEPYLEQPTFTEEMYEVIPKEESLKYNEAQLTVRTEIADGIIADQELEIQDWIDINDRYQQALRDQESRQQNETNEKIDSVEDFLTNNRVFEDDIPDYQKQRMEKGLPAHSIDPESLSPELQNEFRNHPVLKKRKVFLKNGLPINLVVPMYEATSERDLLETLANTPTRQEQVTANKELAKLEDEILDRANSEYEKSRTSKGYGNLSKLHLKEMKILRDKYWPTVRKGIERVAIDIPALRTRLASKARDEVGTTVVKDLNANQWKVGERKSQRLAVKAVVRNNIEEAMRQKKNAAYNAQMAKETHVAIGKVNRAFKWIAHLEDPRVRNELADAGKMYEEAVNFVLDVWNFNPGRNGQAKIDQYNKFVQHMAEQGRGDFQIPREVMEWLTAKESAKQLTVDQVLYLEDYLKRIVKQARKKNTLLRKDEERTTEMIKVPLHEHAINNPNYDENRIPEDLGATGPIVKAQRFMGFAETFVKNNQFIWQEIDGKISGPYAQIFHHPITGAGQYEGPTGLLAWSKMLRVQRDDLAKKVDKFYGTGKKGSGAKAFVKYSGQYITVPEFATLPNFKKSKGKVSKSQLIMILLNMGNAGNRARIENYGIDSETMMTVLKRELEKKDFDFAQSIWNIFKGLAPRINAVHKSQTGQDLDFVSPESFTAFDTVYDGGYFPIILRRKNALKLANDLYDQLANMSDPTKPSDIVFGSPAYEGIVRAPHTKERVGTDEILDLDFNGFSRALDDMIYDITMREPIRDVMLLLKDKEVKADIIAQVGHYKYNVLLNNLALLSKSITANNNKIHSESQAWLQGISSNIQGAVAMAYIAFNPKSIFMSTLAIPNIRLKMGVKNYYKYTANTTLKMMGALMSGNKKVFNEMFELASEVDPSLQFYRTGIDDFRINIGEGILPKERAITTKGWNSFSNWREKTTQLALGGILGGIDNLIKRITTVSVYNMYINGDAKGHSYESVHVGKTPEEVHRNAKAYVSQFLEGTTMRALRYDKAVLQNIPFGPLLTAFWNESRSHLNNVLQEGKDIGKDSKALVAAVKRGDYDNANKHFWGSASKSGNLLYYLITMKALLSIAIYGVPFVLDEEEEDIRDDLEGMSAQQIAIEQTKKIPEWVGEQVTLTGLLGLGEDVVIGNVPVMRDIVYSRKSDRGKIVPRYSVSVPAAQALTDFGVIINTGVGMYRSMEEGYTLVESWEEIPPRAKQQVFNGTGYLIGGFPASNTLGKLRRWLVEEEISLLPDPGFLQKMFIKNTNRFLEDQGETKDSRFEKLQEKAEQGKETEAQQFFRQLREYRNKLAPVPQGDPLSEGAYEVIKYIESNGQWNASPDASGAFGLYQFTPDTWEDVINTPEGKAAGLTQSGRLAKNPRQQEAAMRIWSRYLAKELATKNIPVNIETIYFGHHFGITATRKYAKDVFLGSEKKRLPRGLLTEQVKKANPWTRRWNVRSNGDMRKAIRRLLKIGADRRRKRLGG